jgi:hypothetical protein
MSLQRKELPATSIKHSLPNPGLATLLLGTCICVSSVEANPQDQCTATVQLTLTDNGASGGQASFVPQISIDPSSCTNSQGSYEFDAKIVDSAGNSTTTHWARGWSHNGSASWQNKPEYLSVAQNESLDKLSNVTTTMCKCL